MGILPDWMIESSKVISKNYCQENNEPGVLSYGCGSYGYTVRIGYKFKVFQPYPAEIIDPKNFNKGMLIDVDLTPKDDGPPVPNYILIPPHSFILGESVEEFDVPRDILCVAVGKSTYARCGIIVNVTPLEPEWKGIVTIEISNTTPLPAKIYCGEGIMQVLFLRSAGMYYAVPGPSLPQAGTCRKSYADKKGRYQSQTTITLPTTDSRHGQ